VLRKLKELPKQTCFKTERQFPPKISPNVDKADPYRTNPRIDKVVPQATKSMHDTEPPKRAVDLRLKLLPRLKASRIDILESAKMPCALDLSAKIEQPDPSRKTARSDNEEPRSNISKRDTFKPVRTAPRKLREDPATW
jgi:hypothetical protein